MMFAGIALLRVAFCFGISDSSKGELNMRIKFLSFLLYFFLASLNNLLMLIKYRESERLEETSLPCYISLCVRASCSSFMNGLDCSSESSVINSHPVALLSVKRTKALIAVV